MTNIWARVRFLISKIIYRVGAKLERYILWNRHDRDRHDRDISELILDAIWHHTGRLYQVHLLLDSLDFRMLSSLSAYIEDIWPNDIQGVLLYYKPGFPYSVMLKIWKDRYQMLWYDDRINKQVSFDEVMDAFRYREEKDLILFNIDLLSPEGDK